MKPSGLVAIQLVPQPWHMGGKGGHHSLKPGTQDICPLCTPLRSTNAGTQHIFHLAATVEAIVLVDSCIALKEAAAIKAAANKIFLWQFFAFLS